MSLPVSFVKKVLVKKFTKSPYKRVSAWGKSVSPLTRVLNGNFVVGTAFIGNFGLENKEDLQFRLYKNDLEQYSDANIIIFKTLKMI